MSAISAIGGYWLEGALRTLDAFRGGFGTPMDDPAPPTPSRIIYEGGKVRLRHYPAQGEKPHNTPLLLIYSLIKRPFILDLYPGRSVVETLTKQGFSVYLIDWLAPGSEDKRRGFDEYINSDIANAVRAVQTHSGVEKLSILGYCFGATLGLMYTALHPEYVKNLVALTIPLEMSPRSLPIDNLSKNMSERTAELIVDTYGNAPAWMMHTFFNTLQPAHHLFNKFVVAYRSESRPGYLDTFRRFERWLHSDVPMAGRIFVETSQLWHRNSLALGEMKVGGEIVDLKRVSCPVLNVIGDYDDIVDARSSMSLPDLISSEDKQNLNFAGGHMGAAVSADAHRKLWPRIGAWLAGRDA